MINRHDKILITGGRGFVGSNLLEVMRQQGFDNMVVVDAETYAARSWLGPIFFKYEKFDIRDQSSVAKLMKHYKPDHVLHLAAESHVCRSISGPKDFITTNVNGTFNLLQEFYELHGSNQQKRFIHVSTDEVFGELGADDERFTEESPIQPRSPYAASKASSDLIALAYWETYKLPVIVTNCSNNYGVNQHEEKLIPRTIDKIMNDEPITVYGNGNQVRDWIHVEDHCRGILSALDFGRPGQRYLFGGDMELKNFYMIGHILRFVNASLPYKKELKFVYTNDRPTDDFRYAINYSKSTDELNWKPIMDFGLSMHDIVKWYMMKSGARVEHKAVGSTDGDVKWM